MKPVICIIGGSGFYEMEEFQDICRLPHSENRFGSPSGPITRGQLGGHTVYMLARHGHGHSLPPAEINYRANIWALKELGVTHVLAATACGSLQEEISPGSFVLVDTFLDRTQARQQSFYGGGPAGFTSVAHVPMEPAFCSRFSSRGESLMFKQLGAHVINMTTVPEVCLAKEAGMSYTSIALATDYDCWKTDNQVCTQSVLKVLADNVTRVRQVLVDTVTRIMDQDWTQTIIDNRNIATSSVIGGDPSQAIQF